MSSNDAPPGWYNDGQGGQRWWDGRQWGPSQQQPQQRPYDPYMAQHAADNDARTWGALALATYFVLGWLGSLIILLVKGKDHRFIKHHAAQALNFAIILNIVAIGLFVVAFGGFGIAAATVSASSSAYGVVFVLVVLAFVAYFVIYIVGIVWSIQGIIKASRGEWYVYPVNVYWVRGALNKQEAALERPLQR